MINWLFVINDSDLVFKERIKNKTWPIFANTRNRYQIQIGHKIVFYKAGRIDGQKILGTAKIASDLKTESGKIDSYVDLDEINVWKKSIDIKNLLECLNFIKNKQNWGLYLIGGVRRISDDDFQKITFNAN